MAKIMVNAGHGGSDSGAVGNGLMEKNVNLLVATFLNNYLVSCGHEIRMTREIDKTMSLSERVALANEWGADFYISVHHNAGGGDGSEVIHSIYHGEGEELAVLVAQEFASLGQNPHGSRAIYSRQGSTGDYYYEIRATHMPAIITEFGFIDTADVQAFDTSDEQRAEAEAIGRAINKLLGVSSPVVAPITEVSQPAPVPPVMYRVIMDGTQIMAISDYNQAQEYVTRWVDEGRYNQGVVQRNTDGVNLYEHVKPAPKVVDMRIVNIQKILNRLGFRGSNGESLSEDGVLGTNTDHAIRTLQAVLHLNVDGEYGPNTTAAVDELLSKPTLGIKYTNRIGTRYVQWRLGITNDGVFGTGTKSAVVRYQRSQGLSADGVVGSATWSRLIGY